MKLINPTLMMKMKLIRRRHDGDSQSLVFHTDQRHKDRGELLKIVDELKEELRTANANADLNRVMELEYKAKLDAVLTPLQQMIEMNGEEYFWKHLAKMTITKFNGDLRQAIGEDK